MVNCEPGQHTTVTELAQDTAELGWGAAFICKEISLSTAGNMVILKLYKRIPCSCIFTSCDLTALSVSLPPKQPTPSRTQVALATPETSLLTIKENYSFLECPQPLKTSHMFLPASQDIAPDAALEPPVVIRTLRAMCR